MTGQSIDFSQIDLTGEVQWDSENIGAVYYSGERLWPFGVDLLYTGGIGGASYLPDQNTVYTTGVPVSFGAALSALLDRKNEGQMLGPELILSGTFDDPASVNAWSAATPNTNVTHSTQFGSGALRVTRTGDYGRAQLSVPTEIGKTYLFTVRCLGSDSGSRGLYAVGTTAGGNNYFGSNQTADVAAGLIVRQIVAISTQMHIWVGNAMNVSATFADFDNISVREIYGQSALQTSASLRPLLGRAPKRGRVNEIIFSEQFDNAAWAKTGGTILADVALAPDGTMSADRLVENAGTINGAMVSSGNFQWLGAGSLAAGVSIYAKEMPGSAKRYLVFGASTSSTRWIYVVVDLATGAVTAIRGDGIQTGFVANSISVEPAENGFYRISFAPSSPLAGSSHFLRAGVTDNPTPTFTSFQIPPYTGDGASGILLWGAQAERGSVVSSYQLNGANLLDTTQPGDPSYPFVRFDLSDDRLDTVLPQAVTGDVVIAGRNGSVIAPHSYAANSTFQLGPTSYTGGTPGILRAIGDVVGWSILNKTLTAVERERLMRFYKRRGAKGLLAPGPELVVNGDFSGGTTGWTGNTNSTLSVSDGVMTVSGSVATVTAYQTIPVAQGRAYRIDGRLRKNTATTAAISLLGNIGFGTLYAEILYSASVFEEKSLCFISSITGSMFLNLRVFGGGTGAFEADAVSVKELRPEEEW